MTEPDIEHGAAASHNGHAEPDPAHGSAHDEEAAQVSDTLMSTVATVGVVGVAAAVFEAALIPGIVIGVAAVLAPKAMPRLGSALHPIFRSGMRGAMQLSQKTREMMSEAREQMNDIAAEVAAQGEMGQAAKPKPKANNGAA